MTEDLHCWPLALRFMAEHVLVTVCHKLATCSFDNPRVPVLGFWDFERLVAGKLEHLLKILRRRGAGWGDGRCWNRSG